MPSAPSSSARANAGRVFSRHSREAPRCAISSGATAPPVGSVRAVRLLGLDPVVLLEDPAQDLAILRRRKLLREILLVVLLLHWLPIDRVRLALVLADAPVEPEIGDDELWLIVRHVLVEPVDETLHLLTVQLPRG